MTIQPNPFTPGTWEWAAYVSATDLAAKFYQVEDDLEHAFDNENWGYIFNTAWNNLPEGAELASLVVFLAGKQRDYGPQNILKFGPAGLKVRLWDKIARIENLRPLGGDAVNESLNDSYVDLMGYCVIMDMLASDTFLYPLFADLPQPQQAAPAHAPQLDKYQQGEYSGLPRVMQIVGYTDNGDPVVVLSEAIKEDDASDIY